MQSATTTPARNATAGHERRPPAPGTYVDSRTVDHVASRTGHARLHRVDARDENQFGPWYAVLHASEIDRDRESKRSWYPDEWRAGAIDERAAKYQQLFSWGESVEHPVAIGSLEVTRDDNRDSTTATLFVAPNHRRRGHGTSMRRALEERALLLQRPAISFAVTESAHEMGCGVSRAVAPRWGYALDEENIRRDIDWPRPAGELDRLASLWQRSASAYDVRSWRGPTPDALAEDRAHLGSIMPIEAPHGALGADVERWDVVRLREYERTIDEMGRDLLTAAAVHRPTDRLVGFSDLTVSRHHPEVAYQWDTLVTAPHRGHRLGGLMKIATMRLLERGGDATVAITTFNLASNQPMIALNDALGARVTGCSLSWATILT